MLQRIKVISKDLEFDEESATDDIPSNGKDDEDAEPQRNSDESRNTIPYKRMPFVDQSTI